jgi:DNA-binding MarR family transcriptional regulator
MTMGELTMRGAYLGTNVSCNVEKMVENGYSCRRRSAHDLRSILLKLTNKGGRLHDWLRAIYQRHVAMLTQNGITAADLQHATAVLERLERFWLRAVPIDTAVSSNCSIGRYRHSRNGPRLQNRHGGFRQ